MSKTPRRIRGIIFDMDGLMVDSEPVQLEAINDALRPLNIEVKEPEFIDMVGRKAIENFRALKVQHQFSQSAEQLNEAKDRFYLQRIVTQLKPMPGLQHALDLCREENLTTSIASSSPRSDIMAVLALLKLENHFRIIASGDQVKQGKPHPDIFLKAAEMLADEPGNYLVLEDTAHGVNAAKAAGMYCFAVPNYYTRKQDFSNADRILNNLHELSPKMII